MKKLLLFITFFTSFTIHASTYTDDFTRIEFSNNLVLEYGAIRSFSSSPKGNSNDTYYEEVQITYNGEVFPSAYDPDLGYLGDTPRSSYPSGIIGMSSNRSFDGILFPGIAEYWEYLSFGIGGNVDHILGVPAGDRWLRISVDVDTDRPLEEGLFNTDTIFKFRYFDKSVSESIFTENVTVVSTPIPGTIWLFGTGFIALFKLTRRQTKLV